MVTLGKLDALVSSATQSKKRESRSGAAGALGWRFRHRTTGLDQSLAESSRKRGHGAAPAVFGRESLQTANDLPRRDAKKR